MIDLRVLCRGCGTRAEHRLQHVGGETRQGIASGKCAAVQCAAVQCAAGINCGVGARRAYTKYHSLLLLPQQAQRGGGEVPQALPPPELVQALLLVGEVP